MMQFRFQNIFYLTCKLPRITGIPFSYLFGVVPAYSLFLLTPALEFILIVDTDFYADLTLCLPYFVLLGFISFLKLNRFWPLSHAS